MQCKLQPGFLELLLNLRRLQCPLLNFIHTPAVNDIDTQIKSDHSDKHENTSTIRKHADMCKI